MGYSPQGRKESDTTERLLFHFQGGLRVFHSSFPTVFMGIFVNKKQQEKKKKSRRECLSYRAKFFSEPLNPLKVSEVQLALCSGEGMDQTRS